MNVKTLFPLAFAMGLGMLPMASFAQTIFACQDQDANGFIGRDYKWDRTGFTDKQKFFIKVNKDGNIDPSSIRVALGYDRCEKVPELDSGSVCSNRKGGSLAFNPKIGQGARSHIAGILFSSGALSVTHFICQQMQ